MNLLHSVNRKALSFSIFILNVILSLILLFSPTPFNRTLKISIGALFVFTLLLILKKDGFIIDDSESNESLSEKQTLYKQNSDIMNRFLNFKDLEVSNLQTQLSIKDKLYKQLFDFAPDAFIIFNNQTVSYFNDAFIKLMCADGHKDFLHKGLWQFIHPQSIATAKIAKDKLLSKSVDVSVIELKIITLDNTIKKVRVSSSIIFFEDVHYIFSCLYDLSTHYEQERIKMELENNVAREKFKVECFVNISHDIKTPINVIYSAVQLQEIYTQSKDYDKVLVYNKSIKQNCLRLQKLLNDVLDITKIDASHFKPKLESTNIICSIEYITQSITSYIEHNNISIIFDTNVEDKFVMTDPSLIERIMLNLISNAIKYGKEGGHVWVTLHDEGNHLIISVKDDGIGIPNGQISNIFNRFYKSRQTRRDTVSSNGIGLSLVKSMVKTLDGHIFCLSTEGIGSEFIIILPMESQADTEESGCEYATSLDLNNTLNIELSDI